MQKNEIDERFEKLLKLMLNSYWDTDYLDERLLIGHVLTEAGFRQELEDFIYNKASYRPLFRRG